MALVIRHTNNLKSDLKRNWSSWNFGNVGFVGTKKQLEKYLNKFDENDDFGFYFTKSEILEKFENGEIAELYKNNWVLKDTRNTGLCCYNLKAQNLQDALKEYAENKNLHDPCFDDGDRFDANNFVKILYKGKNDFNKNFYILEVL